MMPAVNENVNMDVWSYIKGYDKNDIIQEKI